MVDGIRAGAVSRRAPIGACFPDVLAFQLRVDNMVDIQCLRAVEVVGAVRTVDYVSLVHVHVVAGLDPEATGLDGQSPFQRLSARDFVSRPED